MYGLPRSFVRPKSINFDAQKYNFNFFRNKSFRGKLGGGGLRLSSYIVNQKVNSLRGWVVRYEFVHSDLEGVGQKQHALSSTEGVTRNVRRRARVGGLHGENYAECIGLKRLLSGF